MLYRGIAAATMSKLFICQVSVSPLAEWLTHHINPFSLPKVSSIVKSCCRVTTTGRPLTFLDLFSKNLLLRRPFQQFLFLFFSAKRIFCWEDLSLLTFLGLFSKNLLLRRPFPQFLFLFFSAKTIFCWEDLSSKNKALLLKRGVFSKRVSLCRALWQKRHRNLLSRDGMAMMSRLLEFLGFFSKRAWFM